MSTATISRFLRNTGAFVAQMFAFERMYERKVVYVRHRLPQ